MKKNKDLLVYFGKKGYGKFYFENKKRLKELDYYLFDLNNLSYAIDRAYDNNIISYTDHFRLWEKLIDFNHEIDDLKDLGKWDFDNES